MRSTAFVILLGLLVPACTSNQVEGAAGGGQMDRIRHREYPGTGIQEALLCQGAHGRALQ